MTATAAPLKPAGTSAAFACVAVALLAQLALVALHPPLADMRVWALRGALMIAFGATIGLALAARRLLLERVLRPAARSLRPAGGIGVTSAAF